MSVLPQTLGALEVSILMSSVLYGLTTLQAWLYAERYSADAIYLRVLAGSLWLFETLHTAFSWVFLYYITVTNYGVPASIDTPQWGVVASVPFTFLIAAMVQLFFANRVRVFSGRLIIPLIAGTAAILHLVAGLALVVYLQRSETISGFFQKFRWLSTLQFALSMAIDIINTTSLCFYLSRRRTGIKRTQRMVDKLMVYTVETGLVTCVCAIFTVIAYFVWPNTYVNFALFTIYPRLFSNSFFAVLNARHSITDSSNNTTVSGRSFSHGHVSDQEHNSFALPALARRPLASESLNFKAQPPPSIHDSNFEVNTKVVTIA